MSLRLTHLAAFALALGLTGCQERTASPEPDQGMACAPWPGGLMVGTARSDELLDVVIDGQGNIYLAGYEDGVTGVSNIEPSGNARGIILKYSPHGELLSREVIDTAGTDVVEALALAPQSGELFIAGRTSGALPGFSNGGKFDLFVGWSQGEGLPPRLAQFGTERPQHPRRLEVAFPNELVIAGYDDIYVPTNYVESWENPLLIKYLRTGDDIAELWQRKVDTSYADRIGGLAVAADGTSYIAGWNEAGAGQGMFVAAIDTQGSEVWNRQQTSIRYDYGAAVRISADGNLLFAGSTFAKLGDSAFGQQDVVVRKLDAATGETIWTFQYGSVETDWVTDMALDQAGQIYLVGETLGSVTEESNNRGGIDLFLIKLSAEGQMLQVRQWGTEGIDSPTAVAVDGCERAFVVGYTMGNLVGPSNGGRDGFVLPVTTVAPRSIEQINGKIANRGQIAP